MQGLVKAKFTVFPKLYGSFVRLSYKASGY